jgi:NAD(P)H-dependent FMN reductase
MLNFKIIIGSTRPGPTADRVIPWITGAAREHGDSAVDVLDLRDWPLPLFGETTASVGGPRTIAAAKILLDDLAWWARALRQAGGAGPLPPSAFRLMPPRKEHRNDNQTSAGNSGQLRPA